MALVCGEALVLSVSPFGERDALARLFCAERGLVRGLVKGARASRSNMHPVLQPFNTVKYEHFRRLDGQLGTFSLEMSVSRAGLWLMRYQEPASQRATTPTLMVVAYLSELLVAALPEEHAYGELYDRLIRFLDVELASHGWRALIRLELFLLDVMGYGLRLRPEEAVPCAEHSALAYVSPASGRAVPLSVARGYEGRLLSLPACLGGPECPEPQDFLLAWKLTGTFLTKALHGKPLEARGRVADTFIRGMGYDAALAA